MPAATTYEETPNEKLVNVSAFLVIRKKIAEQNISPEIAA